MDGEPDEFASLRAELDQVPEQFQDGGFSSVSYVVSALQQGSYEATVAELEAHTAVMDDALDKIVQKYYGGFNKSVQNFAHILSYIKESQQHVRSMQADQQRVKRMLATRSHDLRDLWLRSLQYNKILKILRQVEDLQAVPDKIDGLIASKQYGLAHVCVKDSLALLHGPLKDIPAVKSITQEILHRKAELLELLIEDLHDHCYLKLESPFALGEDEDEDEDAAAADADAANGDEDSAEDDVDDMGGLFGAAGAARADDDDSLLPAASHGGGGGGPLQPSAVSRLRRTRRPSTNRGPTAVRGTESGDALSPLPQRLGRAGSIAGAAAGHARARSLASSIPVVNSSRSSHISAGYRSRIVELENRHREVFARIIEACDGLGSLDVCITAVQSRLHHELRSMLVRLLVAYLGEAGSGAADGGGGDAATAAAAGTGSRGRASTGGGGHSSTSASAAVSAAATAASADGPGMLEGGRTPFSMGRDRALGVRAFAAMLDSAFRHLLVVLRNQRWILDHFNMLRPDMADAYTMRDVWMAAQAEVQMVLSRFLDAEWSASNFWAAADDDADGMSAAMTGNRSRTSSSLAVDAQGMLSAPSAVAAGDEATGGHKTRDVFAGYIDAKPMQPTFAFLDSVRAKNAVVTRTAAAAAAAGGAGAQGRPPKGAPARSGPGGERRGRMDGAGAGAGSAASLTASFSGGVDMDGLGIVETYELPFTGSPYHITQVYKQVCAFADDAVELLIGNRQGTRRPAITMLRKFLDDFMRNSFIQKLKADYGSRMSAMLAAPDGFTCRERLSFGDAVWAFSESTISDDEADDGAVPGSGSGSGGSTARTMKNTLGMVRMMDELFRAMTAVVHYHDDFLAVVDTLLNRYLAACGEKVREVTLDTYAGRFLTPDAIEVLTADPLWKEVCAEHGDAAPADWDEESRAEFARASARQFQIAQQTMEQEFYDVREWQQSRLITHRSKIALLATMHMSLLWLATQLLRFAHVGHSDVAAAEQRRKRMRARRRQRAGTNQGQGQGRSRAAAVRGGARGTVNSAKAGASPGPSADEESGYDYEHQETAIVLSRLAAKFRDLSHRCLLLLRVDLRCHCFFYLDGVQKSDYFVTEVVHEPEQFILALNKDLLSTEEALLAYLPKSKLRYLFDVLPELISAILVRKVERIGRINDHGIAKMRRNTFALQQNLMNIISSRGGRSTRPFDHARLYYELLGYTEDALLAFLGANKHAFTAGEFDTLLRTRTHLRTPNKEVLHLVHQLLNQ